MSAPGESAFFYVLEDELNILFVDDDPILREFALVHLATEKTTVEIAQDGVDGLAKLQDFNPAIILVDLDMPNMDGFEFLSELRKDPRHVATPVIVCTGREDVKAIDRAFQAGATSFVVKPVNWRLLTYQIRFVHRASAAERLLAEARTKAGSEIAQANSRLMRIVDESSRFVRAAVHREPELREDAWRHARALEEALAPGKDAA